jgi:hypothetical protein
VQLVERVSVSDVALADVSPSAQAVIGQVEDAITSIRWPPGAASFTIHAESGKKRGMGNGVVPIKTVFVEQLTALGWMAEAPFPLEASGGGSKFGPVDVTTTADGKQFVVEWETGNISSSHRSMNKLALGLLEGAIAGGLLIVPSNKLAPFLTDRIGNIGELRPYLPLWRSVVGARGYLGIFVVEHDATSTEVPRIKKGTDGRAVN